MGRESEIVHKYTDKNHKPVPELKVGDRCYCSGGSWDDYSWVSTCEVRKVEVRWYEFSDGEGYWSVNYYIRTDVDKPALKSTRMCAYNLDGEGIYTIYRTPQEVMDAQIKRFKKMVMNTAMCMRRTMRKLGYTEEQTRNLLEYKNEEVTDSDKPEAE